MGDFGGIRIRSRFHGFYPSNVGLFVVFSAFGVPLLCGCKIVVQSGDSDGDEQKS